MTILTEPKTSATVRQESINWLPQLSLSSPIDTISSSTWTASDGLRIGDLASPESTTSNTTAVASAWINGGRLGAYCELTNTIVTAGGSTYTETIIVEITPT